MITEDYVSFETAKLLKEKGFDEPTVFRYGDYPDNNDLLFAPSGMAIVKNSETQPYFYSAPTLQMAMKWLREVHNIAIETEWEHLWYAYIKPMTSKPSEEDYYQCESSKYEEACEAAIKYCLENLVYYIVPKSFENS